MRADSQTTLFAGRVGRVLEDETKYILARLTGKKYLGGGSRAPSRNRDNLYIDRRFVKEK